VLFLRLQSQLGNGRSLAELGARAGTFQGADLDVSDRLFEAAAEVCDISREQEVGSRAISPVLSGAPFGEAEGFRSLGGDSAHIMRMKQP